MQFNNTLISEPANIKEDTTYHQKIMIPYHKAWTSNLSKTHSKITKALTDNNIHILTDIIFDNWDKNIQHCHVAIIVYHDIIFDRYWMQDLVKTAKKYNVKFVLITNIACLEPVNNEWYQIIFLKELYGVFHDKNTIPKLNKNLNLYSCLARRTTYPRVKLFADLSRNNLISKGNVSLLGFQYHSDNNANEVIEEINNNTNEFNDIVNKYKFPFKNFSEDDYNFGIEQNSKYTIANETFNDHEPNAKWFSFTEKTFRCLQIPNITLFLNRKGSIDILNSINIKVHPINYILDQMESYEAQNNFIVGLLLHDIFDLDEMQEIATHNYNQIKKWSESLKTDTFYKDIVNKIT